jgi:hypothetical protein
MARGALRRDGPLAAELVSAAAGVAVAARLLLWLAPRGSGTTEMMALDPLSWLLLPSVVGVALAALLRPRTVRLALVGAGIGVALRLPMIWLAPQLQYWCP